MNIHYKSDLNKSYLIVDGEGVEQENYQLQMLRENEIPGILHMEARLVDGILQYYYDISGTTSMQHKYEHEKLSYEDIKKIVDGLSEAMEAVKKYMLKGENLLLDPDYIFCNAKRISFCYCLLGEQDMKEAFHGLTEFFVREVDYRDEKAVHLAYLLHKATMEEHYSIEQIMQEFAKEREEKERPAEEPKVAMISYDSSVPFEESCDRVEEPKKNWSPMEKLKKVIRKTFVVQI